MSNQLFLNFLIRRKILTNEQAENCLQKSIEEKKALATLLVQQGILERSALKKQMEEFQQFTLSFPPETRTEAIAKVDLSILDEILQVSSDSVQGKTLPQNNTLRDNTELQQESVSSQTQRQKSSAFSKKNSTETSERYTLLEILGEGGMGVVERVKDQVLKREVALKRIKLPAEAKQHLAKAQRVLLWRFRREASITAILEHPNIIPLHDMEEKASGEMYFTMCKVDGETLTKKLRKKREQNEELEEHTILSIYMKVCDAIHYAHSRGVIHRDLKPDNIMIGQFGEVYVMDWGIAKLVHETENELENENSPTTDIVSDEGMKTIGGMGTPGYMAPEQAENAGLATQRSDIYSLGKILRECYTRLSPYEELMQRQKTERLLKKVKKKVKKKNTRTAVNKLEERIPGDILAIIEKATKESAKERYENVEELAKDIDDYLHHREVSAKSYNLWEIGTKWIIRNKQKLGVSLFVIVLLLGFLGYSWFEQQEKIREALRQADAIPKASEATLSDFKEQGKRIQQLLDVFSTINNVLSEEVNKSHKKLNEKKEALGRELIDLTVKREEYELANHILTEIQSTDHIPLQAKQDIEKRITEKSMLAKHLKRFDDLTKELKNIIFLKTKSEVRKRGTTFSEKEERIREIILELSKMKEPEILEKLLVRLEEGNQYLLKETELLAHEEIELHSVWVQVLGKLGNPHAGKPIYEALRKIMEKKIIPKPIEVKLTAKEFDELSYTIDLAEALGNSKDVSFFEPFEALSNPLHPENLFLKRTQTAYLKLSAHFKDSNEPLTTKEAYFKRGKIKSKRGEFQGALDDFNKAIELDSQDANLYNARGEVYNLMREKHIVPTAEEYELARKDFSEAIRLKPDFVNAYYHRGKSLMFCSQVSAVEAEKQFENILADIQEVLRLDPKHQKAYLLRAEVFFARQGYSHASKSFEDIETVLKLNPQSSDAYSLRGHLQFVRKFEGDIQNALVDFKERLRLIPEDYEAWNAISGIYYLLGNVDKANYSLERTILINPHLANPYFIRARIRASRKEKEGALRDLEQFVLLDRDNGHVHYESGLIKMRLKLFDEALKDFDKAEEMKTDQAFIYLNRGRLLFYHKKDKVGAKADFIKFLKITKGVEAPIIINFRENLIKEFPVLAEFR